MPHKSKLILSRNESKQIFEILNQQVIIQIIPKRKGYIQIKF